MIKQNKLIKQFFIKSLLFFSITFFFVSCNDTGNNVVQNSQEDFSKRTYELYVPTTYEKTTKHALLFVFHGSGGTGASIKYATDFENYAWEKKYIVCYPDAAGDWDTGRENYPSDKSDDIGFVKYLIEKLSSEYNIDQSKIYAFGFSQGGFFSMNLACKLSNKFSGIATLAATMTSSLYNNCKSGVDISVLMIQGTHDQVVPYNGISTDTYSFVSAEEAIKFWAGKDDCAVDPIITTLPDKGIEYIEVIKHEYPSCSGNEKVVLYEVDGLGHSWIKNDEMDATKVIVEFFFGRLEI